MTQSTAAAGWGGIAARALALLPAALLCLPSLAGAQVAAGRVRDGSGAVAPGALVAFIDSVGVRRVATLSTEDGSFRARLDAPGTYRVRVERIGFELLERPGVVVPLAGLGGLELRLVSRAIRLADLVVEPDRACTVRPADAAMVSVVWEEARKALSGAEWAREAGMLSFRLATWKRTLGRDGEEVQEEAADTAWVTAPRPFHGADPSFLHEQGWVQRVGEEDVFHGPDETALLSPSFQENHCFRLTERDAPMEGLIGLAFEPLEGRRAPDIQGVFWLDRATGELRSLDFTYQWSGGNRRVPAGGRMTFVKLPTGAWIVRAWSIRVPVSRGTRVQRFLEAGGAVLAVDLAVPPP